MQSRQVSLAVLVMRRLGGLVDVLPRRLAACLRCAACSYGTVQPGPQPVASRAPTA
jgi:hypothetical protein